MHADSVCRRRGWPHNRLRSIPDDLPCLPRVGDHVEVTPDGIERAILCKVVAVGFNGDSGSAAVDVYLRPDGTLTEKIPYWRALK